MTVTVLVPIDFSVASLNTLKLALESNKDSGVRAILLYAELLSDSITEMLFYSPEKIIEKKQTNEFREALEILNNRYKHHENEIIIRFLHSYDKNYLISLLEANRVDKIYLPKNYVLKTRGASFNPIPLLKSTQFPIYETEWETSTNKSEQEQLAALFN